jgi:hypothetical protein
VSVAALGGNADCVAVTLAAALAVFTEKEAPPTRAISVATDTNKPTTLNLDFNTFSSPLAQVPL